MFGRSPEAAGRRLLDSVAAKEVIAHSCLSVHGSPVPISAGGTFAESFDTS